MKILLVDDSRTIRNIQRNALAGLGHSDVSEASDGVEALAAIQASPPELILLDWNMPNMDGMTLLTTLRQKGVKTPIIMCTTESEKARVLQAVQAGASNYIVKPFTPDMLAEKIGQTVKKFGVGV